MRNTSIEWTQEYMDTDYTPLRTTYQYVPCDVLCNPMW